MQYLLHRKSVPQTKQIMDLRLQSTVLQMQLRAKDSIVSSDCLRGIYNVNTRTISKHQF